MALYPWVAAVCVRMFGGNLKGVQHVGETGSSFAYLRESDGCRVSAAGCVPALLQVSVVTFSFLPPRPLASTVNDKLELQECLEHGRIAKVSPSVRALLGVGARTGGRMRESCRQGCVLPAL